MSDALRSPDTEIGSHYVEIGFLNDVTANLKLWLNDMGELEDLGYGWYFVHRPNLAKCYNLNIQASLVSRNAEYGHEDVIQFFDNLIADARRIARGGEYYQEINHQRIEQARLYIQKLEDCKSEHKTWR